MQLNEPPFGPGLFIYRAELKVSDTFFGQPLNLEHLIPYLKPHAPH